MTRPEIKIPARSISVLVEIKQKLLEDNDLSLKISGCGKLAVAHYIDELIASATKMETLYNDYKTQYHLLCELRNGYYKLLHHYPEDINDERKTELKALVDKWLAEDEEEEDA